MFRQVAFLLIIGFGFNSIVGAVNIRPTIPFTRGASQSCDTLNARLPDEFELEILNAFGDWSGGVSLNENYWALPSGKVFAPMLEFSYYCVQY